MAEMKKTRCRNKQPNCSPSSLLLTGFPPSGQLAHSFTSASHVRSVCGPASLRELRGGRKVPLREQLAGTA